MSDKFDLLAGGVDPLSALSWGNRLDQSPIPGGTVNQGVFVYLINKSGATRRKGDVVVLNTGTANSFTTTTTEGDERAMGVVADTTIANNEAGKIAIFGYIDQLSVNGTTAIGDLIKTSTTAAQGQPRGKFETGSFAIALSSRTGAGLVAAMISGPMTPGVRGVKSNFLRDISLTTDLSVTGVGFKPNVLVMMVTKSDTANFSLGWAVGPPDTSISLTCMFTPPVAFGAGQWQQRTTGLATIVTAANAFTDLSGLTFDADGFTCSWTKTGAPTGTYDFHWFVLR